MLKRCFLIQYLIGAVVLLMACSPEVKPPKRLAAIPSAAVWAGGPDGGAWILCREDGARNLCTIYNENSGEVWVRDHFVLEGTSRGVSAQGLRYDFFDGERIVLSDGRVLTRAR